MKNLFILISIIVFSINSYADTEIIVTKISSGEIVAGDRGDSATIEKLKTKMLKKRGIDITNTSKYTIVVEDKTVEKAKKKTDRNSFKNTKCKDLTVGTKNGRFLRLLCRKFKNELI